MEIAAHITALRGEGNLLALAAERAGPDAAVPVCPGWRMRDMLIHTGYVHRWATGYVTGQHLTPVAEPSEAEILRSSPVSDEMLPGWFREGHGLLVSALEQAGPGVKCWTFLDAPSPLAFWARRQAHETAVHRVDAQLAAGIPAAALDAFTPGLAADGIDELLMGFARRNSKRGLRSDPPCWLAVHAAGDGGDWFVRMGTDSAEVTRGVIPDGDRPPGRGCELAGAPAALYLLLWNRGGSNGLGVRGDIRVLDTWRRQMRVTWN
jgi:uncharacterized protein (TIGR03083 family)